MNRANALSRLLRKFTSRSTNLRKNRLKRSLNLQGMERLETRALMAGLVGGGKPVIPPTADYAVDQLIVKLKPESAEQSRLAMQAELGAHTIKTARTLGIEVWQLPTRMGPLGEGDSRSLVPEVIDQYWNDERVQYVEPDYIVHALLTPDDSRYSELYGMHNTGQTGGTDDADIDAPEAWNISTGSADVVIGVIDTGVDYLHPDLVDNAWTNPGEIPGDNLDNDNNGYIDDIHGYDFVNLDGDPMDDHNHGTHCSGTIAGRGNNGQGVVGVNWTASIMGIKFLNSGGSGQISDGVLAQEYANIMQVNLTSNSWGGGGYSQAMHDAIEAAGNQEMLFIAAAGNGGYDNDANPSYPSGYDNDNVIAVAASDHTDAKAGFSQWGATTVDLAAPGVSVLSSIRNGAYDFFSGTSMATPHVAGVAALILSVSPNMTFAEVKSTILDSVDVLPNWSGLTVTGGRLNAFKAMDSLSRPTILNFGPDVTYVENAPAVTIDDDVSIELPNVTSMNGYKIELGFTAFASSKDTVALKPNARLTLGGNFVRVDGITIGTKSGGVGTAPLSVTFNANATAELATVVLQGVTFANSTDTPTGLPRVMQVEVFDNLNASLVSATKMITIQPVDDASVLANFGGNLTYTENASPVQLTSTVTIDDIDSNDLGGGKLVVWLPAGAKPQDKLSIVPAGQVTVGLGGEVLYQNTLIGMFSGGVGTTPLEIEWNQSARLNRVESVMRAIGFSNTGDNPTSQSRTVRAKLIGVGGASSNLVSKTIDVTPVNDLPVVSGFDTAIVFAENSPPVSLAPALSVEDVDSPQFGSMTLSIVSNADALDKLAVRGSGRIGIANVDLLFDGVVIGSVAGGQAGSDLVITFNSSAKNTMVQAIGRSLTYVNLSDTPVVQPKTLQLIVTDSDAAASLPRQLTVTITPTNDPPKITELGGAINFLENGLPIRLSDTVVVADADSANLDQGTLKVAVVQNVQFLDQVLIMNGGGVLVDETNIITVGGVVIGGFYGGKGFEPMVVELNTNATPARVQRLLRQVAFVHTGDNPSSSARGVQIAVSDGDGGFSQVVTKTVNVQPVNDQTAIESFGGGLVYTENAAPIFVSTTARVIDPDAPNFDGGSLVVRLAVNADAADIIAIRPSSLVTTVGTTVKFNGVNVGILSGGIGNSPFVVRWNNQATANVVQQVLRRITFETTGENPNTDVRTLTARIADGDGGTGILVSKDISVIRRNDAPVISVPNSGALDYLQSSQPGVALLSGANVIDPDSSVFNGGRLSLKIISGTHESNRIVVSGRISQVGNAIVLDGTTEIGMINVRGGVGTTRMFIDLNANATRANVITLLRSLQFHTQGISTTDKRVIEVSLTDGSGGLSNLLIREVNVHL